MPRLSLRLHAPSCLIRPCPASSLQLEAAAEVLTRKAQAKQERDMTARAMSVVQGMRVQVGAGRGYEHERCVVLPGSVLPKVRQDLAQPP